jgi:biuret amidohydrolase
MSETTEPRPADVQPMLPIFAGTALTAAIESARTALLVIDVQIDFVSSEGAMGSAGVDLSGIAPALARIDSLIGAARSAGTTIVFVRVVTHPDSDSDALKLFMARRGLPPESIAICRDGTPGADYYHVRPQPGDLEIRKPLYSSFVGTRLEEELRGRDIDTLVVVGFTTECCVDCTVRDAFHRNFNVFIVTDACAAYSSDLHYGALNALAANCALLVDCDSVLQAWMSARSKAP